MDIKFWWNKSPNFLMLINYLFDFLVSIKNLFVKKYHSKLKVICVGNFTLGGSGKTPMVRYLRENLSSKGYKCAVLLRGYKGNLKGPVIVNSNTHLSSQVGDEALLHAKDGLTIVSKNRVKGCKYIENLDVDLIILDDGFQNPSLNKDYNLMVVSSNKGIGNKLVFPLGPLRAAKLISSIKNKNKRIVRSFILSDHQEINEKLAKKILEQSEKNNADILTTEKDSVRLLGYNEVSFKTKLLLKSNIVNLNVKADVEIIINDIEDSLNLSKI